MRFCVYREATGWGWALVLSTGRIAARSGVTFTRRYSAVNAATRLFRQFTTMHQSPDVVFEAPPTDRI